MFPFPRTVAQIFQSWVDREIAAASARDERLTINGCALKLGIAWSTLAAYLDGVSFPPNTKIPSLAAAIGYPVEELRAITFAQRRARYDGHLLCVVIEITEMTIDQHPRQAHVQGIEERGCVVPVGMGLTCTARIDDVVAVDQKLGAIAWVAEDLRPVIMAQRERAAATLAQETLTLPDVTLGAKG